MKKYSNYQIEMLKKYYPNSNYEMLFAVFPGKSKKEIMQIAKYYHVKNNNPGHRLSLVGKRFGRLEVVRFEKTENMKTYWLCKCDCGKETIVQGSLLTGNMVKSCGCLKEELLKSSLTRKDHTGERFGLLTAVERIPHYRNGRTYYKCICDCGNEAFVSSSNLVGGHVRSCGCISRKRKHFFALNYPNGTEDNRKYLVYMHISPSGKKYIGITKQNTTKRWQNGAGYKTQSLFWKAIKKYGWSNFEHLIIKENLSEEEACKVEMEMIRKYQTYDPSKGYNISPGGSIGRSLVNPVIQYYQGNPVNFFESISYAAECTGFSVAGIRQFANKNRITAGYSFEILPETHTYNIDDELYSIVDERHYHIKKRIDEENIKKSKKRVSKLNKPINQYAMDGKYIQTFISVTAAKKTVSGLGSISSVLIGKNKCKSAGGYMWKYDTGDHSDIEPYFANGKKVAMVDLQTGKQLQSYSSMRDAERQTGVSHKGIYKACKGLTKSAGGYGWKYIE